MFGFSLTSRGFLAALALAVGLCGACHRRAADKEAPREPAPYGSGVLRFQDFADDENEPLKQLPSAEELAKFSVGDVGRPANLTRPIDWRQNPYGSRTWSMRLNAWHFMPPLLLGFDEQGDQKLLRLALDMALDWVGKYPAPRKEKNKFAWYDMAVASRASMLGYLVRTGGTRGLLEPGDQAALVASAREHGKWLADASHYWKKHNHGLYSDVALLAMCKELDRLPECDAWTKLARARFTENFRATVSLSGVHLEHTPSYHFAILRLLERRLRVEDDADLRAILGSMREAGAWYLQPDGNMPQLGDCHETKPPAWAVESATKLNGARFFEDAGLYSVKTPTAQLLVTGAHHSIVHKHADDLSFVLSENGRRVLVDSGFLTYNRTPERDFLESAPAHNVFLVDDQYVKPAKLPQLSLRAHGEAEGWFAVRGENLHTLPGVHHERTWLYQPGKVLLIVDQFVGDRKPHALKRYFHFAPDFEVAPAPSGVKLRAPGVQGELFEATDSLVEVSVVKGARKAPFQGIISPSEDVLVDAPAVVLAGPTVTEDVTLLAVVELGARPSRGKYRLLDQAAGSLALLVDGQRVSLQTAGSELKIGVGKAAK
jgi:hypothetical protein